MGRAGGRQRHTVHAGQASHRAGCVLVRACVRACLRACACLCVLCTCACVRVLCTCARACQRVMQDNPFPLACSSVRGGVLHVVVVTSPAGGWAFASMQQQPACRMHARGRCSGSGRGRGAQHGAGKGGPPRAAAPFTTHPHAPTPHHIGTDLPRTNVGRTLPPCPWANRPPKP